MNIKIVKILLAIVIVFIASIYLPDIYWSTFKFKIDRPNISYSPILKDLILSYSTKNVSKIMDRKGKHYTRDEYEAINPQLNFAQLVFTGKMPDSINGEAVNVPLLRKNLFQSRFEPYKIDGFDYILYPLIESSPGRVNLEFPDEFFIIKDKMEILDCRTNKLNQAMTESFTNSLQTNGFVFPSKKSFGNPTTRKAFDEGYFVIDSKDQFFHVKRVKGKPYCKKIDLPVDMKIVHFNIQEIPLKEFYGFFITEKNELYLLTFNDYKLIKLNIHDYDYKNSNIRISGDLFNRTISVINENKFSVFVFDRNYKLIDSYKSQVKGKDESVQGKVANYLFPFSTTLITGKSMFVNFHFEASGFKFLLLHGLLLVLIVLFFWLKKYSIKNDLLSLLLVFLAGIYGFIAVLIIRDFNQSNSIGIRG
jgi:hypothetical protein